MKMTEKCTNLRHEDPFFFITTEHIWTPEFQLTSKEIRNMLHLPVSACT